MDSQGLSKLINIFKSLGMTSNQVSEGYELIICLQQFPLVHSPTKVFCSQLNGKQLTFD